MNYEIDYDGINREIILRFQSETDLHNKGRICLEFMTSNKKYFGRIYRKYDADWLQGELYLHLYNALCRVDLSRDCKIIAYVERSISEKIRTAWLNHNTSISIPKYQTKSNMDYYRDNVKLVSSDVLDMYNEETGEIKIKDLD